MATDRNKPPCRREDALAVAARLREGGHVAYFAGGCVRDTLMGLQPADYDVATDAPPRRVRQLFSNTQAVGAAFGVILVRLGESVVEVATFRTDGIYSDGRHPDQVRFATAEEDAQRRDFTINGLFFDPAKNEVIDYVGGQSDLIARRLRAIGEPAKRFDEDHLRLLRGVRFAARFNLQIEPATAAAIRRAAPHLKGISPERIAEELRMMLTPVTRKFAWPMLWDFHLAPVIFRLLLTPSPGTPGEGWGEGQIKQLFLHVLPDAPTSFGLALAAAVLEVTGQTQLHKPQLRHAVTAIRRSLRISNEESDAMQSILESLPPLLAADEPTLAMKKRFLALPNSGDARHLLAALADVREFVQRAESLESEFAQLEKSEIAPLPLLNGDDLTAAGMTPGPAFKRILDAVYDAQLEGRVSTKDDAMKMATAK
jgi:poly(A) polymerase